MGLSVAPVGFWWLAWVAIVPLWMAVRKSCLSQTIFSCLVWGIGYHGLALFWITGIHPMTWMGVSWVNSVLIALFAWIFITGWGVGLVIGWGAIFHFYLSSIKIKYNLLINVGLRLFGGIFVWCLLESLWSYSPLWWSSIAYTQSPYNLTILQFLKFSGITTVSTLLLIVNGLFAEGLIYFSQSRGDKYNQLLTVSHHKFSSKRGFFLVFLSSIVLISSHFVGYLIYSQPITVNPSDLIRVGIVQGNIPNTIKLYESGVERAIARYTRGYQNLSRQNMDLIITPETALPLFYEDIKLNTTFYQAVLREQVPVILGAFGVKGDNYTNSLFTIDGEGKITDRYDKVQLVPLGEYIPFAQVLSGFINRLSPLEAQLVPGEKEQLFTTPVGQTIVGICYESAYSRHFRKQTARGGEFMVTASNNAHYSKAMPSQHHAQDVMRAIENDRWMARATNTGYSGIVDPHGNTIWISSMDEYEIYGGEIYRRESKTLYVLWGDWLLKIFGGMTFLYLLYYIVI